MPVDSHRARGSVNTQQWKTTTTTTTRTRTRTRTRTTRTAATAAATTTKESVKRILDWSLVCFEIWLFELEWYLWDHQMKEWMTQHYHVESGTSQQKGIDRKRTATNTSSLDQPRMREDQITLEKSAASNPKYKSQMLHVWNITIHSSWRSILAM